LTRPVPSRGKKVGPSGIGVRVRGFLLEDVSGDQGWNPERENLLLLAKCQAQTRRSFRGGRPLDGGGSRKSGPAYLSLTKSRKTRGGRPRFPWEESSGDDA